MKEKYNGYIRFSEKIVIILLTVHLQRKKKLLSTEFSSIIEYFHWNLFKCQTMLKEYVVEVDWKAW